MPGAPAAAAAAAAPPLGGVDHGEGDDGEERTFRGTTAMHVLCFMHQLALVFSLLLTLLGILCPMFCACCLLQRGMVRRTISATVRALLMKTEMSYTKPDNFDENQRYLRSTLRFLDWADQDAAATLSGETLEFDEAEVSRARQKRLHARDRLAHLLAASEIEHGIIKKYIHYCPLGCHDSPQDACDEISECAEEGHLGLSVPVPAVNRWVKLFRPMTFWLVGIIFGYITLAFEFAKDNYLAKFGAFVGPLTEEDLLTEPRIRFDAVGLVILVLEMVYILTTDHGFVCRPAWFSIGDADTFEKKRYRRFTKAWIWLSHAQVRLKMPGGCNSHVAHGPEKLCTTKLSSRMSEWTIFTCANLFRCVLLATVLRSSEARVLDQGVNVLSKRYGSSKGP